ncbi:hypothetical protein SAMN04488126_10182 [Bhargavaea beijingensis]|uniref:Pullulanase n=1 Tax=Bhargavaea beijingensis TaxID=426756 RepID=A0A1G6XM06_9BACL|nr:DUF6509 family protein [Bhargavaea beijingensis]SDD78347.1 hypothetical protein SAMN04488126_10182 [Bhargavaea beijingensis]
MEITGHTVELLNDPTGIIEGDRYEFFLDLNLDEEDELYTEGGVKLRVLFAVQDGREWIANYDFIEAATGKAMGFALEEDEEKEVLEYCRTHKDA